MTMIKPTSKQVRAHYASQGFDVRISRDGHIVFRRAGEAWREGRWLDEYRLVDGQVVLA